MKATLEHLEGGQGSAGEAKKKKKKKVGREGSVLIVNGASAHVRCKKQLPLFLRMLPWRVLGGVGGQTLS
jgi:hypothetical protein